MTNSGKTRDSQAGIYVHFPYCKRKCAYCAFVSTPDFSTQRKYIYRLKTEITQYDGRIKADTVYFGGGTPSVMPCGSLTEIFRQTEKSFDLSDLTEFTVEANPESVTPEFLSECKCMGVNRISMGLQSASDEILKTIGRIHTVETFVSAVRAVKNAGIENVSGDLILGLPEQTQSDADGAVDLFDSLGIDHVSVYALSVEEGTPLYKSGYRPDGDRQADMYEATAKRLKSRGYERYEVSNFARGGKIAEHNYKYWTGADYYGFGVSAHSLIGNSRFANPNSLEEYLAGAGRTEEKLTKKDEREEMIMLRLRTSEGLDLAEYSEKFGGDLREEKRGELRKLIALGSVIEADGKIRVTDKGQYVLNSIITELL